MGASNSIGSLIKTKRLEKGMTLEQLGSLVGVGKSTVRKWEEGMILDMKRSSLISISKILDISPTILLGLSNNETSYHSKLLATDTASADGSPILIHAEKIDKTQQHRNILAEKIRNSDYTDEQLDKIEKMINLMI